MTRRIVLAVRSNKQLVLDLGNSELYYKQLGRSYIKLYETKSV